MYQVTNVKVFRFMLNRICNGNDLERKSSLDYLCHLYDLLIREKSFSYFERYPDVFGTYEEAKQSAIIGCMHGLEQWDSRITLERLEPLSWHLKRYVENFMAQEVHDTLRHKKRKDEALSQQLANLPADKKTEPEYSVLSHEFSGEIEEAMKKLNDLERNILLMHFREGLTLPEIAELMGVTRQYIRRTYNQKKKKMCHHMKNAA